MKVTPAEDSPSEGEVALRAADTAPGGDRTGLRQRVLQGGVFLVLREGVGVLAGLIGGVLLARLIGPDEFGLFVAIVALFTYLQNLATLGINAFLIRVDGPLERVRLDHAFTILLVLSAALTLLAELAMPAVAHFTHLQALGTLGRATLLVLPIVVVGQVPLAKLEHDLEFRKVAFIEGAAQVLLYVVALPLAAGGLGATSGVVGWLSQQAFLAAAVVYATRYRPRFRIERAAAKEMVRYGLSFSASIWVWQLRTLVNPIVVARYGGPSLVGIVGLAIRLAENLAFVKTATWRLSIAALARVQGRADKLVSCIEEGMALQLLALGPFLVVFAAIGGIAVRLAFGEQWLPALVVFPYVAVGYLVNSMFNIHSSALYVVRRNWDVTRFHLVHVALFAVAAVLLVPEYGGRGYGFAELIALPSYWLIHHSVRIHLGAPHYSVAALWLTGFAVAVFTGEVGWAMLAGLLVVVGWPRTWREINRYFRMFRAST